jgi:hypothetical protein
VHLVFNFNDKGCFVSEATSDHIVKSDHVQIAFVQQPRNAKLAAALCKAQGEFVQPEKNKEVEVKKEGKLLYKTRYADLKNVIESFRGALSRNGLSFVQKTRIAERGWRLVLILMHESGEFDETEMPILLEQAPQLVGSQLTYLKRYQAAAYFGIAADDDDDGNGAAGNQASFTDAKGKAQPAAKREKPVDPPKPDTQKADNVHSLVDQADPGEYVIQSATFKGESGKKVKEIAETTLKKILKFCDDTLAKAPPAKNAGELFTIRTNVNLYLKSVEVTP